MRNYLKLRPAAARETPWTLPALCKAYGWPSGLSGGGVIAIFEAAGGWVQADLDKFFAGIGQPVPSVTDISVDGTKNSRQSPRNAADIEATLDIICAAVAYFIATGNSATIRMYWGQDIAQAIAAAHSDGCDVFSSSWGNDEAAWGTAACQAMENAAAVATAGGMTIFAAAGDNDSSDGGPSPANVDAPASCPHVIGCGGTTKTATAETVWNDNPGKTNGEGTGGGYSNVFPAQSFQIGAPPAPTKEQGVKSPGGRMVPDVAANADPNTGYEIVVYGQTQVIGGTSAVAPLYAGLFAAFGKKLGNVLPKLWQNPAAFLDITSGSNGEFSAKTGPDPCTGLGAPIGTRLAALFAAPGAPVQKPSIGSDVHFVQKKPPMYGEGVVHLPAKVTAVWGDSCVNLMVFTDGSNSELDCTNFQHMKWVTSVSLDASDAPQDRSWHWPEMVR